MSTPGCLEGKEGTTGKQGEREVEGAGDEEDKVEGDDVGGKHVLRSPLVKEEKPGWDPASWIAV